MKLIRNYILAFLAYSLVNLCYIMYTPTKYIIYFIGLIVCCLIIYKGLDLLIWK